MNQFQNASDPAKCKQQEFCELVERLRADDPEEVSRLGDQFGRMVFGTETGERALGNL